MSEHRSGDEHQIETRSTARHEPGAAESILSAGKNPPGSPARNLRVGAVFVGVVLAAIFWFLWLDAGPKSHKGSGRAIAFVSFTVGGEPERLYTVDLEGGVKLVRPSETRDSTPSWSPDGDRLAFASYTAPTSKAPGGAPQLWVMEADGSGPVLLGTGGDFQPSWSPDGRQIVFVSGENSGPSGALQLFVVGADGEGRRQLSPGPSLVYGHPAWSPSGTKIAYHARMPGTANNDIFTTDLQGASGERLTNDPSSDETPAWSPDGSRIVFASLRSGNSDIYVMNADGSGLIRLTSDPGRDTFPVFSPDGSQIAFVSTRTGGSQIFLMNADGSNVRQLMSSPGTKSYLSW